MWVLASNQAQYHTLTPTKKELIKARLNFDMPIETTLQNKSDNSICTKKHQKADFASNTYEEQKHNHKSK